MTSGLAVLGAWVELAVVVGVLGYVVLRRSESDPLREAGRDLVDDEPPDQGLRQQ